MSAATWDEMHRELSKLIAQMVASAPNQNEARKRLGIARLELAVAESDLKLLDDPGFQYIMSELQALRIANAELQQENRRLHAERDALDLVPHPEANTIGPVLVPRAYVQQQTPKRETTDAERTCTQCGFKMISDGWRACPQCMHAMRNRGGSL